MRREKFYHFFSSNMAAKEPSTLKTIYNSPAFTATVQVGLFVAGVVFIQSPLMDFLVPQL